MKLRGLTLRYGRVGALHLRKICRRRAAAFEVGINLGLGRSQGGGGSQHGCTLVPAARRSRGLKKLVLGRRRRKMMEVLTVRHHQVGRGRGQGQRGRPVTLSAPRAHPLHVHDHRWFKVRRRNVDNVSVVWFEMQRFKILRCTNFFFLLLWYT